MAPTACRHLVSGTLSLPFQGCFSPFPHGTGSLSVSYEYLALPDGPGGFTQDSSCPALLRIPLCFASLRVRSFHALWPRFPEGSTHDASCCLAVLLPRQGRNPVGLGWSPVARHYWGNHFCFLFLRVLRCFSSPGSPPAFTGCRSFRPAGCPIRKSRRQGPFAPRPGLSQLVTSFIACKSLGIRQMPLPTSFTLACWPTSISNGRGACEIVTYPLPNALYIVQG